MPYPRYTATVVYAATYDTAEGRLRYAKQFQDLDLSSLIRRVVDWALTEPEETLDCIELENVKVVFE